MGKKSLTTKTVKGKEGKTFNGVQTNAQRVLNELDRVIADADQGELSLYDVECIKLKIDTLYDALLYGILKEDD